MPLVLVSISAMTNTILIIVNVMLSLKFKNEYGAPQSSANLQYLHGQH